MFMVYKIEEIDSIPASTIKVNNNKKSNNFPQRIYSPLKAGEKSSISTNSLSFITNNSQDTEKILGNFIDDGKTALEVLTKNNFMSKKKDLMSILRMKKKKKIFFQKKQIQQ